MDVKVVDFVNSIRFKYIAEMKKVRDENLANYETNKNQFKVNRSQMNDEKIEELIAKLFANKFAFAVETNDLRISEFRQIENFQFFKLYVIVVDFYRSSREIEMFK